MNESFWEAVHPGSVLVVQREDRPIYFLVAGCARHKGLTMYRMHVYAAIPPHGDALVLGARVDCDFCCEPKYIDRQLGGPIIRVLNSSESWPLVGTMIDWMRNNEYDDPAVVAWRAQDVAGPREYTIPQLEKIVGHKIRIVGNE